MLLPSRKIPWLERAYASYGRRLLRRAFARVWVGGAPWPAGDGPAIAYLNHSAWWDPIVAVFLSQHVFGRDGYGIMNGEQLGKYPFFRRVGCFGVTDDSVEDVRALAAYAADLLRSGPRRTLWIFPQGELLPARVPLAFRSGTARLSRAVPDAPLIPVAMRYELRTDQRPELFVRLGQPVRPTALGAVPEAPAHLTRRLERCLRDELDLLDADLRLTPPAGYRAVLDGRGSLSGLYDRTFGRVSR